MLYGMLYCFGWSQMIVLDDAGGTPVFLAKEKCDIPSQRSLIKLGMNGHWSIPMRFFRCKCSGRCQRKEQAKSMMATNHCQASSSGGRG